MPGRGMPGRPTPPRLRRHDTPTDAGDGPLDAAAPLAGVSSTIITAATRRVARRWRDEATAAGKPAAETETMAGLLAALALAVDQGRPGYVTSLVPRPTPSLAHRLVEMLQTELLQAWSESATPIAPSAILGTLNALEQVRQAISDDPARQLSQHLSTSTSEGLDLLVEVIHDLRSPLTSILFLAETLQRGQSGPVNEVQHRQVGLIYSAALGLSALVADAIELARGGDELADGDPSPFSVAELMESVRTIVRPMAEEKGLAIRLLPLVHRPRALLHQRLREKQDRRERGAQVVHDLHQEVQPVGATQLRAELLRGVVVQRVAYVFECLEMAQQTERRRRRRVRPGAQQLGLHEREQALRDEPRRPWLEREQVAREPPVHRQPDGGEHAGDAVRIVVVGVVAHPALFRAPNRRGEERARHAGERLWRRGCGSRPHQGRGGRPDCLGLWGRGRREARHRYSAPPVNRSRCRPCRSMSR